MASVDYTLGNADYLEQLFPPAELANKDVGLSDMASVIAHYTKNSLVADGIENATVTVSASSDAYDISITANADEATLAAFSQFHRALFSEDVAGKAISGRDLLMEMGLWNPMSGFPVNHNPNDGKCKWNLFPPLGLNVMNQSSVVLMHYPPWQVLQQASFLDVMTMHRWTSVLSAAGVPDEELGFYRTFIDVNPIAAPGSGQSEYPNDYFPIMMASGFFDQAGDKSYIRSMLRTYLEGPKATGKKYTLPLLICGSPLYDPQAPGWFRAAFKDRMPVDKHGIPTVDVLQCGSIKLFDDSERETPYMIANHMIAAGVTGKCTNDPSQVPDIRKYEAQDLVAATFLKSYKENPDLDPLVAKKMACERWFGHSDGSGAPEPSDPKNRQIICALAQMDLFFVAQPSPHPKYTFEEAMERCAAHDNCPCSGALKPPPGKMG